MSESTFYEWKKRFDQVHLVPESMRQDLSSTRKAQYHLEKLALELEVLRQCPCGPYASMDEKVSAIKTPPRKQIHNYADIILIVDLDIGGITHPDKIGFRLVKVPAKKVLEIKSRQWFLMLGFVDRLRNF